MKTVSIRAAGFAACLALTTALAAGPAQARGHGGGHFGGGHGGGHFGGGHFGGAHAGGGHFGGRHFGGNRAASFGRGGYRGGHFGGGRHYGGYGRGRHYGRYFGAGVLGGAFLASPYYYDDYYYGDYGYDPYYENEDVEVYANAGARYGGHEAACAARFRSYDPATDTYQPFHGPRRRCPL